MTDAMMKGERAGDYIPTQLEMQALKRTVDRRAGAKPSPRFKPASVTSMAVGRR
jgi:hypothetical protein